MAVVTCLSHCLPYLPCPALRSQLGGFDKVINHVVIGLKTMKGTKQLKLDPTIYDALQKEKVRAAAAAFGLACRSSVQQSVHARRFKSAM